MLSDDSSETREAYEDHIEAADKYAERGLYQKAIEEYDAALQIQNTETVWTAVLNAYEKRYAEDTDIYENYLNAARAAFSYFSDNSEYLLKLAELYLVRQEYESAYKALNDALEQGMDNERVSELLEKVRYSYDTGWKSFTEVRTCVNGFYAVSESGVWTYIEEDGTNTDFTKLQMAGPVGESGIRVIRDEDRGQLINTEQVVQGILSFDPIDAGIFSEGLVAIADDTGYAYYDSFGDKQFGNYTMAGTFTDGQAAVQQEDTWSIVDKEGDRISEETYEDIILHADGSHIKDGVMIAKKDGMYRLYKDGKATGEYCDADIITEDNMIAVCIEDKWGYVDTEGNELIPPTYAEAKSFSNGLAAVSDGERWGFIDASGKLVIDYTFFGADYFNSMKSCMVVAEPDGAWQLISLNITE